MEKKEWRNKFKTYIPCLRAVLGCYNFIMMIVAGTLIFCGVSAGHFIKDTELHNDLASVPFLFYAMGVLLAMWTAIGFPCIIYGNAPLLFIYACAMGVTYVINLGTIASLTCFQISITKDLQDAFMKHITNNHSHEDQFGFLQSRLECCGVNNYTDWVNLSPQRIVPESCCQNRMGSCITVNYSDLYQTGCYEVVKIILDSHRTAIVSVLIGLLHLPLLGVIISSNLANILKKSQRQQGPVLLVK